MASFILSKRTYATCGTYDVDSDPVDEGEDSSTVGTGTEVIDKRPVLLGFFDSRGRTVNGTMLEVDSSGGSPSFVTSELEPTGDLGCFALRSRADFTPQEAKYSK